MIRFIKFQNKVKNLFRIRTIQLKTFTTHLNILNIQG